MRALRWPARDLLHEAIGRLPYTTGLVAGISISLVSIKLWRQHTYPYFAPVVGLALAVFIAASIAALVWSRRQIELPHWVDAHGPTAWVLGLQCGVLLLIVPIVLLTKSVRADDALGWTFGFLNKRWLIGLYQTAIAAFLLCPVAIYRWQSASPHETRAPVQLTTISSGWIRTLCGSLVLILLMWYVAGPPWHLERHHREFDWHEQAILGPLQAIAKGYLPYIGPASTQYGPGAQVLLYTLMTQQRHFDIVSFRTACAMLNFLALVATGLGAYRWVGFPAAVAVIALELTYSPFAFFFAVDDGTFAGVYGWAFAGRYLAPLLVVPAVARACFVTEGEARWWPLTIWGGVLGIGAWIAQENLSTTVVAGGLVLAILWLTRTVRLAQAARIVLALATGFACVAASILLWYAGHDAAGEFVHNYFLVPRTVAMGYSNMWWPVHEAGRPDRYSYYFTLPFLILAALLALWRVPALRLEPLDWRRARFIAFVCVLLASYQTALLRSDYAHLMNTMIALPFVLVLGALDLPRWVAVTRRGRIGARLAFIALALAIYPTIWLQHWGGLLVTPAQRFRHLSSARVADPPDGRVAFERATPLLANEPLFAGGAGLSMRAFLDFATDVHEIVGARRTIVTDLGGRAWSGALYFLADLTPAPYPLDRETMAINAELRADVVDHMRAHPSDYECLIGTSLQDPEAVAFLETHPGTVEHQSTLPADELRGAQTVHILLAQGPS